MGQQKRFFETENIGEQQGRGQARTGQSKNKQQAGFSPGTYVRDSLDSMGPGELLKLVIVRLRRNWVSFRFQLDKRSHGAFRPKKALKIGVIAALAYFVFAPDDIPPERLSTSVVRPVHYTEEQPQYLEVGQEEGASKPQRQVPTENEAAPVSADELLQEQILTYIERYHATAIGEMNKFGIPASISLAQGLIESRAGTSKLAKSNNNHFGMKCFSRSCKRGHCTNFTDDTHKDFFRKFKTPWESWRAHSELLASGRYAKLKRYGRDYRAWAYGLKSAGYATDRTYAEKLIGIIERYKLHQYDR